MRYTKRLHNMISNGKTREVWGSILELAECSSHLGAGFLLVPINTFAWMDGYLPVNLALLIAGSVCWLRCPLMVLHHASNLTPAYINPHMLPTIILYWCGTPHSTNPIGMNISLRMLHSITQEHCGICTPHNPHHLPTTVVTLLWSDTCVQSFMPQAEITEHLMPSLYAR